MKAHEQMQRDLRDRGYSKEEARRVSLWLTPLPQRNAPKVSEPSGRVVPFKVVAS